MMPFSSRREFLATVPLVAGAAASAQTADPEDNTEWMLWYSRPASEWTEALPVGNGRLGAMVFGGVQTERLQLNEDTLWSGAPSNWNNSAASDVLPEIRRLVLEEHKYRDADTLCRKMQGTYNESYVPAGNLLLTMPGSGESSDYRRQLNLDTAIAKTSFTSGAVKVTREVFSSAVDGVIVVRISSASPGKLAFHVTLDSPLHFNVAVEGKDTLRLKGKAPSHVIPNYVKSESPVSYSESEGKGMRYECWARCLADGGKMTAQDNGLQVEGANSATILITIATGFQSFTQDLLRAAAEIAKACKTRLDAAARKPYSRLRADHIADHRKLFRRVSLQLGSSRGSSAPTDERLKAFKSNSDDQQFLALYFQYGRYLLIASSRPGTQAANLQGIWNELVRPPWSSNWTANINVQMNYWLAETCNLSECHRPLFDLIEGLGHNGAKTASVNYKAPGWVSHHNVDLWRQSAPVGDFGSGDPTWANWQMSGPWLCAHLWEHYRFTGDRNFLRSRAYPLMKGSAQFYLTWLIDDKKGGLTTCPSFSTENNFKAPDGRNAQTSAGCTMDIALIRELFTNCVKAATILQIDKDFANTLQSKLTLLPSYKVGRYGQLQEWSEDFEEATPGQRHMSHLYPVYPGGEITARNKPEFWKGAQVSLERRLAAGGGYTGWSRAWVICLWARLENGDLAHESLTRLMEHSTGLNLFDTHPAEHGAIFQIDGNFGAPAGLAEMLLQSHEEAIHILPALPKAWPEGHVQGLRARGGIGVDITWANGQPTSFRLQPASNGTYKIRTRQPFKPASTGGNIGSSQFTGGITELQLQAGHTYDFEFV